MTASEHSVMIMAGGTGGHVYPGLAVAAGLKAKGWDVAWIGTARGLEARVVPANHIALHTLKTLGLRGKGLTSKVKGVASLLWACLQALALLLRRRPSMVIGFGGYAAGPAGAVARLLGIPLLIHEQNAVAGTTNRLLARRAARVMAGFDGAFTNDVDVTVTGNPLRDELCEVAEKRYPTASFDRSRRLRVAILGGSQGALALNTGCPKAFSQLSADELACIDIKHQCGLAHVDVTKESWGRVGVNEYEVMPFVEDMAALYHWADLAICRAGALTVSEVAVTGTPSVLVPLPQAIDNHQMINAEALMSAGGASIVPQSELENDAIPEFLTRILRDAPTLKQISDDARAWSKPNATQDVVSIAEEVACG
jgi:UDP-N-acetylglucosamine--N-acetylmuramyl-(pentapeptide) pyrophosphoryl-undecaprenol N-acetylglucosamine transferase